MKFAITKLYRTNEHGDLLAATVTFHRDGGQMRKLTGKIGGPNCSGIYQVNLLGGEKMVNIEIDEHTTLHVCPVK